MGCKVANFSLFQRLQLPNTPQIGLSRAERV